MESITKPSAELDHLIDEARKISSQTKSPATKRAYNSDLKVFTEWCESVGLEPLPASSETVAMYVVHLNQLGRRPSTIDRALASISQAHLLAGHRTPIDARVLELKKGVNRIRGTARSKKKPITLDRLRRVIANTETDFIGVRDRALLLVGWTAALRRSEICAIEVDDIDEEPEGLVLTLGRSKTDQEGAGRKIGLPFVDAEQPLCAVRALQKWIALAEIKDGPVFCQVGRGGKHKWFYTTRNRLSRKSIALVIKRAVERAGYEPAEYSGHSLRSGLATTLANAGIQERQIMSITGHKSLKTLREYIRSGGIFFDHPVTRLFTSASSPGHALLSSLEQEVTEADQPSPQSDDTQQSDSSDRPVPE